MEELGTLVVSDTHFGRKGLGETRLRVEQKELAAKNMADFIRPYRKRLRIVLNGDIFHRPGGYAPNAGEGFDASDAAMQVGPLSEELRTGMYDIHYLAGNCDPEAARTLIIKQKLVRLLGLRQDQVKFPGYVQRFDDTLITHGHIFTSNPFDTMREAIGLRAAIAHLPEDLLPKAKSPTSEFHDWVASLDHVGGWHNITFQLKRVLDVCLLLTPASWRDAMLIHLRAAWDRTYRRAFFQHAASDLDEGVETLVMSHTHQPGMELIHKKGRSIRMVNSGSAGADMTEDGSGTMVLLMKNVVPQFFNTYHSDSPNTVTSRDVKSTISEA